jgi:hypothetical protein
LPISVSCYNWAPPLEKPPLNLRSLDEVIKPCVLAKCLLIDNS